MSPAQAPVASGPKRHPNATKPAMDLVHLLEGRLLFAVPKKGRLSAPTLDLLQGSNIKFRREHRLDIALVTNLPIALVFLPAADIPTFVGEGRVALGITGQDVVAEYHASNSNKANGDSKDGGGIEELMELGFGKCKLQIQVPEKGQPEKGQKPITDASELIGKNIVTSFTGLSEQYFANLEGGAGGSGGVNGAAAAGKKLQTKIKYVGGSVEAACALGVADGIVDLVESGETMKAAGLKAIDTVIESGAVLIRSTHSQGETELVNRIAKRIRGVINAQKYVLCTYNIAPHKLETVKQITPGKTAPTVTQLQGSDWVAVQVMVEDKKSADVMDALDDAGATDILIVALKNSRTS